MTIRKIENEPPPRDDECGECDPCMFLDFNMNDLGTHCVNCSCIICIPGG